VWTWTLIYPFLILLIGCSLLTLANVSSHASLSFTTANLMQTGSDSNHVPFVLMDAASTPLFTGASAGAYSAGTYPGTTFDDTSASVPSGSPTVNMSNYLLSSIAPTPLQAFSRYNAFYSDFVTTPSGSSLSMRDTFTVFFNTSCQWSSSFGLNMYNNEVLQSVARSAATSSGSGVGTTTPLPSINLSIHPLPKTQSQQTQTNTMTAIIVAIGFAFIPANFIAYTVKEEQDKVKHQQLLSGVSAAAYWASNYIWDFCNYMVMGLLCLLIFRICSIPQLIDSNTGGVFLAIVLYGLSICPFNYMASFCFTESTSAQNTMLLFYIFSGALLLIATIVMGFISSTMTAVYYIKFFCRLIPSYCFGESIANIIARGTLDVFDITVLGYPAIFMTCEIFVYSGFVLLYEKVAASPAMLAALFGNPAVEAANTAEEDADVINEKKRLMAGQPGLGGAEDMIKVMGLRKVYKGRLGGGNKIAVQDLWMGVPEGQCLGFLGINGAGKTTTLKMLTGDIIPGSGTATLNGLDILKQQNDVRRLLGYCQQHAHTRCALRGAPACAVAVCMYIASDQHSDIDACCLCVASSLFLSPPRRSIRRADRHADGARAPRAVRAHQGRTGGDTRRLRRASALEARPAGGHRRQAVEGILRRQQAKGE
jgi:ATP-binding cassette subfamily A (ABC1) protein 3